MQMIAIQEFSLIAWLILGALALMSGLALSIVLIKLAQFARLGLGSGRVGRAAAQALEHARAGDLAAARAQTDGARALRLQVLGAMLAGAGQAGAMVQARDGIDALSRHMRGLEGVVQAAPMLGLLGTVVGMIEAFGKLAATSGAADPAQLAGGIWTALVTTALGLAIAILFYLISLWLDGRITAEAQALERLIATAAPHLAPAPAVSVPVSIPEMAPSASPFATAPSPATAPPATAPPAPQRAPLAQPLPGATPLQRTDPGSYQPRQGAAQPYADPGSEAGPVPEGFRSGR